MALFKIFKGSSTALGAVSNGTNEAHEGFAYFTPDDGKFYIDIADATSAVIGVNRIPLSANHADLASTANYAIEAEYAEETSHAAQASYADTALWAVTAARSKTAGYAITANKVHQNASITTSANYRILLSTSGTGTAEDGTLNKSNNLLYNPSSNQLQTGSLKLTGTLEVIGDVLLSNETYIDSLITKDLIVNGPSRFNNLIQGTATNAITAGQAITSNYSLQTLTANYASTAENAKSALTATYANTANYAIESTHAKTANYATSATKAIYANTASFATTAIKSTCAEWAGSANYATEADHAQTAHFASTANKATTAGYSTSALNASHAQTAHYAASAAEALHARTASYATTATKAASAGWTACATWAGSASFASSATNALEAIHSITANSALTATNASHAQSAHYASSALNATFAQTATFASSANTASTAGYATSALNASHAASTDNATTATEATHAMTAHYATSATEAKHSQTSNYASCATEALHAKTASYATTATKAGSAGWATCATQAGSAIEAKHATTAHFASTANAAGSAIYAGSATNALEAIHATSANTALTATNASHAQTAHYASSANTSVTAGYATTALHASNAMTAQRANTAGYAITATNAFHAQTAHYASTASVAGKISNLTNTDIASSSDDWRKVWMSYSDGVTGRPALSSNLVYQTSTDTLKTKNIELTGELNVTGNTVFSNETYADSLTLGNLIVNGPARFNQIPLSVTPNGDSNDESIATTAFVKGSIATLAGAMHFIGKATVAITDGSTTDPVITGYSTKTAGDVIIDKDNIYEYVWTAEGKWERLGPDGSYKIIQTAVNTGATATNKWVSYIYQDTNGNITATMATLNTSGTWSGTANRAVTAGYALKAWTATYATTSGWAVSAAQAAAAGKLNSNAGSTTQPIFFSGGVPTATSYALKATVNNGTATRLAYYSGNTTISSGTIESDGNYIYAPKGDIWSGAWTVNTAESATYRVGARSGSGRIYFYSEGSTSGKRGIWLTNSANTATGAIVFNQSNQIVNIATFAATGTASIRRDGISTSWHKGRDNALIKLTSISGYSPIMSIKTINGSWDIGAYNNTSYQDDLIFSYVTDALNSGIVATATSQIKFGENGLITAPGGIYVEHKAGEKQYYRTSYSTAVDAWFGIGTGNENVGIYNASKGAWMIYANANHNVNIPDWSNIGTNTNFIYITTAGRAIASTATVGNEEKLVYLSSGTITQGNPVYTLQGGTYSATGTDINSITTIGNYYCSANARAKTFLHTPYADSTSTNAIAFILKNEAAIGTGTTYLLQTFKIYTGIEAFRNSTNSGTTWNGWKTKVYKDSDFTTKEGDTNNPVYIAANGKAIAIDYTIDKSVPSTAVFTDTLNTAGSTDTSSKIFLIGATSQTASSQTYSDNQVYATDGALTARYLVLSNTGASGIEFSRTDGNNYIKMPPGGGVAFCATDSTVALGDASLVVNADGIKPGKSNTYDIGTTSYKWKTIYTTTVNSNDITINNLTASQAVSTDANKKLVSTNLTASDPTASGTGITYIATISQNAVGAVTATKSTVRSASTSQTGVLQFTAANTNIQLNTLTTGSSTPQDADYYISQFAGGGTATTTFHRRPVSALWSYIKGKITSDIPTLYAGNIKVSISKQYNTEPEMKSITITGNNVTATAAVHGVQMIYDTALECLNFVFS